MGLFYFIMFSDFLCCVLVVVNRLCLLPAGVEVGGGGDGGWSGLICLLEVSV